jgi:hypothetical protein
LLVIPTVILIGALVRRWWIVVVAAVLWPIAVVVWGDVGSFGGVLGAGVTGAANAGFGALVGTAIQKVAAGLWMAANASR